MEPTRSSPARNSAVRRYASVGVVIVIVAGIVAAVALRSDEGGDKETKAVTAPDPGSREALIRSGPMTTEKAELLGEDVDFGPGCDLDRGRVKIPSNYALPCVEPFKGDNGGVTSPGVTAEEITVVVYQADPKLAAAAATGLTGEAGVDQDPDTAYATLEDYAQLYQDHYEQYGRTVKLVRFKGTGAAADETRAKADAIAIADQHKPFAVIGGPSQTGAFADEIVARKILCVSSCAGAPAEEDLAEQVPYRWPSVISTEQYSALAGEMVVKGLQGEATQAGDPSLRNKKRVFGVLYYEVPDDPSKSFPVFRDTLEKGGIKLAATVPFFLDFPRIQEIASTAIAKLKDAGVTSVVLGTDPYSPKYFSEEATKQNYFPEWVIGPNLAVDLTLAARQYDQRQWANAFGVTALAARGNQEAQESYNLYRWQYGKEPPANTYGVINGDIGFVFAGIHLAGPELTPRSFGDGLFRAPERGGTATAPKTSRGRNDSWPDNGDDYVDYYGSEDVALIFYDPDATGEDEIGAEGKGMYRYAKQGQRYEQGKLPTDTGLFDEASSVTVFDEVPADSRPPTYPSPAESGG